MNEMNYDIDLLREKIINYYGAGAQFFEVLYIKVDEVENMSDEEVIEKAKKLRIID